MKEKAGKFLIGFVACATALLVPRGMAELASFGETQTINLFKFEYLVLCLVICVLMAASIMLYYWSKQTTPTVIFSGSLALFATIASGLTTTGISSDLEEANARLNALSQQIIADEFNIPVLSGLTASQDRQTHAVFTIIRSAHAQTDGGGSRSGGLFGAADVQQYYLVLDQAEDAESAAALRDRWSEIAPNAAISENDDGTYRILQQSTPVPLDSIAEDLLRMRPEIQARGFDLDGAGIAPAQ